MTKEQELTKPRTAHSSKWINVWQWQGRKYRGWGTWASKEEAEAMAHEYMMTYRDVPASEYCGAMPESEWAQ